MEATHFLVYFTVDEAICSHDFLEIVVLCDIIWHFRDLVAHILVSVHGSINVEVFDAHGYEFGSWG